MIFHFWTTAWSNHETLMIAGSITLSLITLAAVRFVSFGQR